VSPGESAPSEKNSPQSPSIAQKEGPTSLLPNKEGPVCKAHVSASSTKKKAQQLVVHTSDRNIKQTKKNPGSARGGPLGSSSVCSPDSGGARSAPHCAASRSVKPDVPRRSARGPNENKRNKEKRQTKILKFANDDCEPASPASGPLLSQRGGVSGSPKTSLVVEPRVHNNLRNGIAHSPGAPTSTTHTARATIAIRGSTTNNIKGCESGPEDHRRSGPLSPSCEKSQTLKKIANRESAAIVEKNLGSPPNKKRGTSALSKKSLRPFHLSNSTGDPNTTYVYPQSPTNAHAVVADSSATDGTTIGTTALGRGAHSQRERRTEFLRERRTELLHLHAGLQSSHAPNNTYSCLSDFLAKAQDAQMQTYAGNFCQLYCIILVYMNSIINYNIYWCVIICIYLMCTR